MYKECFLLCSAEAETKLKLEKVGEIKKINAQMMSIKSEISKYEDTLKEYQLYKRFLEALTPKVSRVFIDVDVLRTLMLLKAAFTAELLFVVAA